MKRPALRRGYQFIAVVLASLTFTLRLSSGRADSATGNYLSPVAIAASKDKKALFIACAATKKILLFSLADNRILASLAMSKSPSGLALSPDGGVLYVTCADSESEVAIVETISFTIIGSIPCGHTATAPAISPDGHQLYICNRFNNNVSVIDLIKRKELERVTVGREPVSAAVTNDGKYLFVANMLPSGRSDVRYVASTVSVIDTASRKLFKRLQLPNGSSSLREIKISPDGRYAALTHIVARFNRLPVHATEGWINVNALTVVDLTKMRLYGTVLLDGPYQGAANPWGIAWSSDDNTLAVVHSGTHEVSIIDFQKLLLHLPPLPVNYDAAEVANLYAASKSDADLPDDLPYFPGNRLRMSLPKGDLGPRAITMVDRTVYIANYFSDTLTAIDLNVSSPQPRSLALGPKPQMDAIRRGELYFHDARICYEGWQSCASCHPGEARTDGLNWDLLNDGIDNPKNTKSLLHSPDTPPVMSLGVRSDAKTAIRAGIHHILFTSQSKDQVQEQVAAIEAYIKSLKPLPSPFLVRGELSEAAVRGGKIFRKVGCVTCHSSDLFTDLRSHNTSARASDDKPTDKFYTPTLIEVWRTAPYLHNGSATTIRDVLTTYKHGATSNLTKQELEDLSLYVLSL